MTGRRLHEGEVEINEQLVHRLLVTQFPHLSNRPINEVRSTGTVHAIYLLGDDLCVRLLSRWAGDLEKEVAWLPKLARWLPLAVPEPVAKGKPGKWISVPLGNLPVDQRRDVHDRWR